MLSFCAEHNKRRVVTGIDSGEHREQSEILPVPYLVFEIADGNLKTHDGMKNADLAWKPKAFHGLLVGLYIAIAEVEAGGNRAAEFVQAGMAPVKNCDNPDVVLTVYQLHKTIERKKAIAIRQKGETSDAVKNYPRLARRLISPDENEIRPCHKFNSYISRFRTRSHLYNWWGEKSF